MFQVKDQRSQPSRNGHKAEIPPYDEALWPENENEGNGRYGGDGLTLCSGPMICEGL